MSTYYECNYSVIMYLLGPILYHGIKSDSPEREQYNECVIFQLFSKQEGGGRKEEGGGILIYHPFLLCFCLWFDQTVKVFTDQYISKVANSACHPHSSRVIS